jgi:hypothetical protein
MNERQRNGGATKRPPKPDAPTETTKPEELTKALSVPVDLEDYKGARKKLRHAVKAVVKVNSASIAEKLVSKAQEGDIRGTEMMLSLIEKKKQGKDAEKKRKKRTGPSWAELLASEPEWDESMEDGGKKLTVIEGR